MPEDGLRLTCPVSLILPCEALQAIRYHGSRRVDKVALLPFRSTADGHIEYLVAAPLPIRNPRDMLPFAIARGTRKEGAPGTDGEIVWLDAGREAHDHQNPAEIICCETAITTALREGEEELGLDAKALLHLYDAGVVAFKDYGLRLIVASIDNKVALLPQSASRDVRWYTNREAHEAAVAEAFHSDYLPILDAIESTFRELTSTVLKTS